MNITYISESVNSNNPHYLFPADQLAAFETVCSQMLEDVQERLVYRTHIYIRAEILGYRPADGDLAYPDKLEMMEVSRISINQGTHCTGKTGKIAKRIPCQGKHRDFGILPKHRKNTFNLVWSSCKFPDSQGKRYCDICRESFQISFEAG